MKRNIEMFTLLLGLTVLSMSCTKEFQYTIPDKYAYKNHEKVEYAITMEGLLDEMVSRTEMTKFPEHAYTTHQASSYDRLSVAPGTNEWFANSDGSGYIRKETNEGRQEYVMMEDKGPGVITRIWLTSLTDAEATVRFYFNGSATPDWTVDSYYLKDFDACLEENGSRPLGKGFVNPVSPTWKRGSNLYLPIPYSSGCKVTYEERSSQINPNRYYQINYRSYPAGTGVETFSANVFNSLRGKISDVNAQIANPTIKVSGRVVQASQTLSSGKRMTVSLPSGTNAITELRITVSAYGSFYADAMDGLVLAADFDGTRTVCQPLADLATAGPGAPKVSHFFSQFNGTGELLLMYIMPYKENASISIKNFSAHNATVNVQARVGGYSWDSRSLYFHAASKHMQHARLPYCLDYPSCYAWDYAVIQGGRGVLRADMYSIDNPTTDWPGEGDEKIYVDGESFPSYFGTGTEDYFGFCFDRPYQYPFVGESRLDNPNFNGIDTYMRVRDLDGIPFKSSLKFEFELGGWQVGFVNLRNSVLWYGDLGTYAVGANEYNMD